MPSLQRVAAQRHRAVGDDPLGALGHRLNAAGAIEDEGGDADRVERAGQQPRLFAFQSFLQPNRAARCLGGDREDAAAVGGGGAFSLFAQQGEADQAAPIDHEVGLATERNIG